MNSKLNQSQFKCPGFHKINPPKTNQRRVEETIKGQSMVFDKSYQLNPQGKYFNSKYKNSSGGVIPRFQRAVNEKGTEGPGPGYYQLPSDFGIY